MTSMCHEARRIALVRLLDPNRMRVSDHAEIRPDPARSWIVAERRSEVA